MSKFILGGVLAAQLLLSAGLLVHSASDAADQAPVPLLAFPAAKVTRIVIDDNTNSTTLALTGADWHLSSLDELPANAAKLNTLLGNLTDLTTHWPVVESASGRERFEVSNDKYQRKLSLYDADTLLGTYYFGTSPGFRQTHVRRDGEDQVYAVNFNNFDLPGDSNDWLNKSLLAPDQIDQIEGPDYLLQHSGDTWTLSADPATAPAALDDSKVTALTTAWRNLRVTRVSEAVPAEAQASVVSVTAGDSHWRYTFSTTADSCFVQRDDIASSFSVAVSDCERLAAIHRADLLAAAAVSAPAATEDATTAEDAAATTTAQ